MMDQCTAATVILTALAAFIEWMNFAVHRLDTSRVQQSPEERRKLDETDAFLGAAVRV